MAELKKQIHFNPYFLEKFADLQLTPTPSPHIAPAASPSCLDETETNASLQTIFKEKNKFGSIRERSQSDGRTSRLFLKRRILTKTKSESNMPVDIFPPYPKRGILFAGRFGDLSPGLRKFKWNPHNQTRSVRKKKKDSVGALVGLLQHTHLIQPPM
jgi:hypothetical protein